MMSMIWKLILLILFGWVLVASWLFEPPMSGVANPAVYRIFFFHVPIAIVTFIAYGVAMYHGLRYLSTKNLSYDSKSVSAAALGTLFCALATISGSIFAKYTWGSFWNWDPRETSIVVLLLVYCAYFSLRVSVAEPVRRANLAAVYSILGFISAVFTIFIWPRIAPGLHPGAPGDSSSGMFITMSPETWMVFLPSIAGFLILFYWLYILDFRIKRLAGDK